MRTKTSSVGTSPTGGSIHQSAAKVTSSFNNSAYIVRSPNGFLQMNKEMPQSNVSLIGSVSHSSDVILSRNSNHRGDMQSLPMYNLEECDKSSDYKLKNLSTKISNTVKEETSDDDSQMPKTNSMKKNEMSLNVNIVSSDDVCEGSCSDTDKDCKKTSNVKVCETSKNSARKIKFNKVQKKNCNDSDDNDYADDEHTDVDENDDVSSKASEEKSATVRTTVRHKNKEKSNKSVQKLCELTSNLNITEEKTLNIDDLKKSFSHLKVLSHQSSSSEESSDGGDNISIKYELVPRGPVKSSENYDLPHTLSVYRRPEKKYTKPLERTLPMCSSASAAIQSVGQTSPHSDEWQRNIIIPDSEKKFFDTVTQEVFDFYFKDLQTIKEFRPSFETPGPVHESMGPMNGERVEHEFCNNTSPSTSANSYTLSPNVTESSDIFSKNGLDFGPPYPTYSSNYYQSNQLSSSAVEDVTGNLNQAVIDDVASTSDYGSPSGTNDFSPAPSVSPEHSNETDTNYHPYTDCNSIVGSLPTFNSSMNLPVEPNPQPGESNNISAIRNIIPQVHPQVTLSPTQPTFYVSHQQPIYTHCMSACHTGSFFSTVSIPSSNVSTKNTETKSTSLLSLTHNGVEKMVVYGKVVNGRKVSDNIPAGLCEAINTVGIEPTSSIRQTNFRRIVQDREPPVYESIMQISGYERLVNMCKTGKKKNSLLIQWCMTLVETGKLDENKKSLILITLLNQLACLYGDKPATEETKNLGRVWAEKLLASVECVYQLLKRKEIFILPDQKGNTPLKIAAFDNYKEALIARVIADCIVKNNDEPDEFDKNKNSLLHHLCERGGSHVNVLAELLNVKKNGLPVFNVSCQNNYGETPLHVALNSKFCSLPLVRVLIDHQARVDIKDCCNRTPLHVLLYGEYDLEILRILLQSCQYTCQYTFSIEDNEKNTPLMVAGKNLVSQKKQLAAIQMLCVNSINFKQLKQILTIIDPSRREDIKKFVLQKKKK